MDYVNGAVSYLLGPGFVPQLLLTIVVFLVIQTLFSIIEAIVTALRKVDRASAVLVPDTVISSVTIPQSPYAESPLIFNSENEKAGLEFSYSMYLMVSPETFEAVQSSGEVCDSSKVASDVTSLKHIFHRGSKTAFPLMAPGLFCHGNKNTLRLYMNSTTKWDNYVEIPNVPVGKWFHIVIMMKGKYLDVYINGNVTVRHQFHTVPKLNFGNMYVMAPIRFPKATDRVRIDNFKVDGPIKGMVSRINYYAYALNYSQIDELYRQGPSTVVRSTVGVGERPPYFYDDWWVTKY